MVSPSLWVRKEGKGKESRGHVTGRPRTCEGRLEFGAKAREGKEGIFCLLSRSQARRNKYKYAIREASMEEEGRWSRVAMMARETVPKIVLNRIYVCDSEHVHGEGEERCGDARW